LSRRGTAAELGVSDRTLRRWLAGEDNPSAESVIQIQQWLDAHRG
jgi:transcriptional regulator with XRE-family HTH domain